MNSPLVRRMLFLALAFILVLFFLVYSPSIDSERFKQIIPQHPAEVATKDGTESSEVSDQNDDDDDDDANDTKLIVDEGNDDAPSYTPDSNQDADNDAANGGKAKPEIVKSQKPPPKTSQLHFLVPASNANIQLCYNLVSAAANRFPVPLLVGWHGKGLFSAKKSLLAKIRAIEVYLDSLPAAEDEDLILIVDGFDVLMQLPPEVMIARYFEMRVAAENRLAELTGLSIPELHEKDIKQTVFWGPDKICWPINWDEPRCWAVPSSSLPEKAFGPKSGNGDMYYNDPRWLNSGTVMAPVSDLRELIHDTMAEINATYDKKFSAREADQYYLSNIWGRQEYYRSLQLSKDDKVEGEVGGHRPAKLRDGSEKTEFHIAIDYESQLFQTKAGYEPFFGFKKFNKDGFTATMDVDMFSEGKKFKPYDIRMPVAVQKALTRLYESVPEAHHGKTAGQWLAGLNLGTNFVTRHIYALWHCTASKEFVDEEYPKLWFFSFASSLIKASIAAFQDSNSIGEGEVLGGRKWVAKTTYPDDGGLRDRLGGAWSDEKPGKFVGFKAMCGEYFDTLFDGDELFDEANAD